MKDIKHIGSISLSYGLGDTHCGEIFESENAVSVSYLRRPTAMDRTNAAEIGELESYYDLNALFWGQITQYETEIMVTPDEDCAELWLNFACEEWVNAVMNEQERNCFMNLMSSCLAILE